MTHRPRRAKIVATLGPASATPGIIRTLFDAGSDVFRLNFSHGTHEQHRERLAMIRAVEKEVGRPIGVMMDLQGPKLRVATFASGPVELVAGAPFRLDLDTTPGDIRRCGLPHPEIFAGLRPDASLLLDDGRMRLRVDRCGPEFAETTVVIGGRLSERKGVNVPDVVLPMPALTAKDLKDLAFGLDLGIELVALSFVQTPADLDAARSLIGERAWIVTKLEKPSAVEHLDEIVAKSDIVMVARGDLGVEMPAEKVPGIQRRTVRACRAQGKPVIVATQMLESMTASPVPTRAEASDVASAIYNGADAVMLSAESASGRYPVEAVDMMSRIICEVESDPHYRTMSDAARSSTSASVSGAICAALRSVAEVVPVSATVTFTRSGATSLRAARERLRSPIISMTPLVATARRLCMAWGVHSVHSPDVSDVGEMVDHARGAALSEGYSAAGDDIVIAAGMPFGNAGATNMLRIARV